MKMTCAASGHPKPLITWYHDGDAAKELDFVKIVNQSLIVEDIMELDEGMYQCFAKNDGGEIQSSAQLIVMTEGKSQHGLLGRQNSC